MSWFLNKKIWVTGASSGIGKALAEELAQQGASLVLSSRRQEVLEQLKSTLRNPAQHRVVPLDLERYDTLAEIVNKTLPDSGPIDILINNAGISQRELAMETKLEVDRKLMDINYFGTIAMSKALLPDMIKRGSGSIVCVSSVAGIMGTQLRTGYSGSKFAVHGYMEGLRAELHQHGIQVLVAAPGYVNTDVALNALNGHGESARLKDQNNLNGISPEACALSLMRAIERGKHEVVIGKGASRIAPWIKRISPALTRQIQRKYTDG